MTLLGVGLNMIKIKYYKDDKNKLYVNPILENNPGLIEITETGFKEQLALNKKPTAEQLKKKRLAEIKARLTEIDNESIRPLRAVAAGTSTQFDTDKLTALETERASLAAKLVTLNG